MSEQKLKADQENQVTVTDQEKQVSAVVNENHMTESDAKKIAEDSTPSNCCRNFGFIGGVIAAIGVGVLTSLVIKEKNQNNDLNAEIAMLNMKVGNNISVGCELPIAPVTTE